MMIYNEEASTWGPVGPRKPRGPLAPGNPCKQASIADDIYMDSLLMTEKSQWFMSHKTKENVSH